MSTRLLTLCMLLLGSVPAMSSSAQAPLPAGQITPETLQRYCSAQAAAACLVPLAGEYTLQLASAWQLPRSMHLHFGAGSELHVSGGTLDFAGATVDAPPAPIFPDADRVRGLAAARPEWFARQTAAGPVTAPALAAAYAATEPWGTIYLQARAYLSPFGRCVAVSPQLPFDSPRTLVGAGRPMPDSTTAPTHLQGGTLIVGAIYGHAPLRLAHLGLDVGPEVSAGPLGGCSLAAGIFIEQPVSRAFVSGDRLEDVSVLTNGAFNMHSVMIAGHTDAEVRDLWIWTLGGTHGLVMKSEHSTVDGLHCSGAVSDCLIVKSDYATDLLGRAVGDRVSHVDIHPLKPGAAEGGIMVESRWDTVRTLTMEDIHETGAQFGIVVLGSTFYRPREITVRNWVSESTTDICLFADKADSVRVTGFQCGLRPTAVAGAVLVASRDTLLENGSMRCDGTAAECAAGKTTAILNDARGTRLAHLDVLGLGGGVLHYTGRPPSLTGVHTTGMTGEPATHWTITRGERLRDVLAQTKPNLRILYDTVASRERYAPFVFLAAACLLVLLAVYEGVVRRRARVNTRPLQRT